MPSNPQTSARWDIFFTDFNLTVLLFSPIAVWLTKDFNILRLCLGALAWYWWVKSHKRTAEEQQNDNSEQIVAQKKIEWQPISSLLLLVSAILWFFIESNRIVIAGHPLNAPERWEFGALVWNLVFCVVSHTIHLKKEMSANRSVQKIIPSMFLSFEVASTIMALLFLKDGKYLTHLTFVLVAIICSSLVNISSWLLFTDNAHRYINTVLYADAPTIISLVMLWCLARKLSIFLSGAIAFQFLACFAVSLFIEGGIPEVWLGVKLKRSQELMGPHDDQGAAPTPVTPAPLPS